MSGEIFDIDEVYCRLRDGRHPHEAENLQEIEDSWSQRKAAKPELFDGETVLGNSWRIEGNVLRIECQKIRYAALLHWLDTPASAGTGNSNNSVHFFASAVVKSSDGKILMGRMGDHTANAGRVYMPSGSIEVEDFRNGQGDFASNMRREVLEETGLDLNEAQAAHRYSAYFGNGILALFRQFDFPASSADLLEWTMAHLKNNDDNGHRNELAEVMMRNCDELDENMPTHIKAYVMRV
ncbi:MAG: NUDIX hydrolase [Rhizobiaceae bacterium]